MAACKAPDGSYWALQAWQPYLPHRGYPPWLPRQTQFELHISHWTGQLAQLEVQIVSDVSKLGIARLAQVEAPKWEDNEATFADLQERLKKTIAFLATLKPEQFDDGTREVTFPVQKETATWPGSRYLFTRVLPNVFFHCATAYNIMRHNGVEIGKADFLGPIKD